MAKGGRLAAKHFRRPGGYFVKYEAWLASPAYRSLSCGARCLLEEFQRLYRPSRNALSISVVNAAKLLNVSRNTARGYFCELLATGFIALCEEARYLNGLARTYRLTFEPFNGREPTDDWRLWEFGQPVMRTKRSKSVSETERSRSMHQDRQIG